MKTILQLRNVVKSFSGVEVLHSVNFELEEKQVHGLIGENGAGKSTLMKILMGEHRADSGIILLDGKEVGINSSAKALDVGIAMIQQELSPIPHMTIAENIFLGRYPSRFGVVNKKRLYKLTSDLFNSLDLKFDPDMYMSNLSISEIQMIEIAKAVSYGSRIVIMDEPTSAITEVEVVKLYNIIALLKEKGVSIVYITHKIDELFHIADFVTVLRDGIVAGSGKINEVNKHNLITMMVGREITEIFPKVSHEKGEVLLSVKGLERKNEFADISFDLHEGEILGIAGLMGAGRTEIATAIFGERKLQKGTLIVGGKTVPIHNTTDAVKQKMALVSEDRKQYGVNLIGSVQDNILMVVQKKISTFGIVKNHKSNEMANSMVKSLSIKVTSIHQRMNALSGGNQQKVVLAKWLLNKPDIIILDDPTRGIDVGSKTEIYKLINELAYEGVAIIFISSEMPEIIGMCDRVIVLHRGKIKGELLNNEITQEKIMTLASGEEVV